MAKKYRMYEDTSKYVWYKGKKGNTPVYQDENNMFWEDVDYMFNSPFRNMDLGTVLARNSASRYSCSERGEYVSRADKEAEVLRKKVSISDGTKAVLVKYGDLNEVSTYVRLIVTAVALSNWCKQHKVMLYDWHRYQPEVHIKIALQAAKLGLISKGRNTSKATLIARCEAAIAEYGTALLELQPIAYRLGKVGVMPRAVIEYADSALWSYTKRCL